MRFAGQSVNFPKDTSSIAIGTTVIGTGLLLNTMGAEAPLAATYAASMALFLAFIAITANTYRIATQERTIGRLLRDPEPGVSSSVAAKA